MSKPKKKREKAYRKKHVSKNPISEIFGGLSGDHAEHLQRLNFANYGSLTAMAEGRGDRASWDQLVGSINMGNVMCEQGIGNEFRDAMLAGRDAMCEVGKRWHSTGTFEFVDGEQAAVAEALACHEAQLENIRSIDVERASDEVVRRVREHINTKSVRAELAKEPV